MEPKEPTLQPSHELLEIERRKRPVPRGAQTTSLEPSPELRELIERSKGRKP